MDTGRAVGLERELSLRSLCDRKADRTVFQAMPGLLLPRAHLRGLSVTLMHMDVPRLFLGKVFGYMRDLHAPSMQYQG